MVHISGNAESRTESRDCAKTCRESLGRNPDSVLLELFSLLFVNKNILRF